MFLFRFIISMDKWKSIKEQAAVRAINALLFFPLHTVNSLHLKKTRLPLITAPERIRQIDNSGFYFLNIWIWGLTTVTVTTNGRKCKYLCVYIYRYRSRRITSLDQMHLAVVLRGMGMMSGGQEAVNMSPLPFSPCLNKRQKVRLLPPGSKKREWCISRPLFLRRTWAFPPLVLLAHCPRGVSAGHMLRGKKDRRLAECAPEVCVYIGHTSKPSMGNNCCTSTVIQGY